MYYAMSIPEILVLLFILLLWVLSIVCFIKRYEKISTIERADMPSFNKKTNQNDISSSSSSSISSTNNSMNGQNNNNNNSNNHNSSNNPPNNDASLQVASGPPVRSPSNYNIAGNAAALEQSNNTATAKVYNYSFDAGGGNSADSFTRSNTSLFYRPSPVPAAKNNIYLLDETANEQQQQQQHLRKSDTDNRITLSSSRFQKNPNLQYIRTQQINSFQSNIGAAHGGGVGGGQSGTAGAGLGTSGLCRHHPITTSYTTHECNMLGRHCADCNYGGFMSQTGAVVGMMAATATTSSRGVSPYSTTTTPLVNQNSVTSSTSKDHQLQLGSSPKRMLMGEGNATMLKSSSEPAFNDLIESISASTYLNNVEEEPLLVMSMRSASIDNDHPNTTTNTTNGPATHHNTSMSDLMIDHHHHHDKSIHLLNHVNNISAFHKPIADYASSSSSYVTTHQHYSGGGGGSGGRSTGHSPNLTQHQRHQQQPHHHHHHHYSNNHSIMNNHGQQQSRHHHVGGKMGARDDLLDPRSIPKVIQKSLIDLHKRSVWNLSHKQALTYVNAKSPGGHITTTTTTTTIRAAAPTSTSSSATPPSTSSAATMHNHQSSASAYMSNSFNSNSNYPNARVFTQPRHHNEAKIRVTENYV